MPAPTIGDRILELRQERGWTQEELARLAGLTVTTICRVERDKSEPRPSTQRKIAKALGVRPRDLIE